MTDARKGRTDEQMFRESAQQMTINLLEEKLSTKDEEIEFLRRQLVAKEKLCDKSDKINKDLRDQVDLLSAKLQLHHKIEQVLKTDAFSQTEALAFLISQASCNTTPVVTQQQSKVLALPAPSPPSTRRHVHPPLLTASSLEALNIIPNGRSTSRQPQKTNSLNNDTTSSSCSGPSSSWAKESNATKTKISDLVRECASQSFGQSSSEETLIQDDDYVYDEKTRTYYSPSTQLYWYPDSSFFYDPRTSSYYHYDSSKKSLKYHSTLNLKTKTTSADYSSQPRSSLSNVVSDYISEIETLSESASNSGQQQVEKPVNIKSASQILYTARDRDITAFNSLQDSTNQKESPTKQVINHRSTQELSISPMHPTANGSRALQMYDPEALQVSQKTSTNTTLTQQELTTDELAKPKGEAKEEIEEGEVTIDDDEEEVDRSNEQSNPLSVGNSTTDADETNGSSLRWTVNIQEVMKTCRNVPPPSIRLIVLKSSTLVLGSLDLMPPNGGIIGSADECHVRVPDERVAPKHCRIRYNSMLSKYIIASVTTTHETKLNGVPLSQYSETMDLEQCTRLNHEDRLELGDHYEYLVHIHDNPETTCDWCEPGKVMLFFQLQRENERKRLYDQWESNAKKNKRQYKDCRNPFMRPQTARRSNPPVHYVQQSRHQPPNQPSNQSSVDPRPSSTVDQAQRGRNPFSTYRDRAQERRETVGSDNPYEKTDLTASERPIQSNNIGHRMLQRMGWSQGDRIGTDPQNSSALSEPLQVQGNLGTSGLGSTFNQLTAHNGLHQFLQPPSKRTRQFDIDFHGF